MRAALVSRLRSTAAALALLTLGGCGAGAAGDGTVTLTVTRDFGRTPVLDRRAEKVPSSETVMRLLQRNAQVKTRYGGGFVRCIGSLCADAGARSDWLYFVNGSEAPKGAAATRVRSGDRIWWDRRDWTAAQRIPAVVGSFPEPFQHGPGARKRLPVRVECVDLGSAPCKQVVDALVAFDVPAARGTLRRSITSETLRVLVGSWDALRDDTALAQIEDGPQASGVFAEMRPDGRSIALLDERGRTTRTLRGGSGLIAATAADDDPPVWVVTGTDDAGLRDAAAAFGVASLQGRFAVAIDGGEAVALPLAGGAQR